MEIQRKNIFDKSSSFFFSLLQIIVSYPPTKQLTYEEQDLVWKFRYYLTNQEKVSFLNVFMYQMYLQCLLLLNEVRHNYHGNTEFLSNLLKSCRTIYVIILFFFFKLQKQTHKDTCTHLLMCRQSVNGLGQRHEFGFWCCNLLLVDEMRQFALEAWFPLSFSDEMLLSK